MNDRHNFEISNTLECVDSKIKGNITILNKGDYVVLQRAHNPIDIGISLVDNQKNIIVLDYFRIPINQIVIKKNESIEIVVDIDISNHYNDNNISGIRIELVQKGIAWIENSRDYF